VFLSICRQELMHYVLKLRLKHEATDLKNLDQRGKLGGAESI